MVGILTNLFTQGSFTDAHALLTEARNVVGAQGQYVDGLWTLSVPWAVYLLKTGDTAFVRQNFATGDAAQPSLEDAAHAIAADRTGPMGTMEATDDIDTQGYWTTDDYEALLGLAAYRYIAATLGDAGEASWASTEYASLLGATNTVLGQTISGNHLDYLPCSLTQPNTANRCANPKDANWTSPFANWAWEGSLLGAPLSGPGQTLIDATYDYGFGRLRGLLPPDTAGGFPGEYYSSGYNAAMGEAGLASADHRDQGIVNYEFMIANSQSGPLSWWESSGPPDPRSPWVGRHPVHGPGMRRPTPGAWPEPTRCCWTRWWPSGRTGHWWSAGACRPAWLARGTPDLGEQLPDDGRPAHRPHHLVVGPLGLADPARPPAVGTGPLPIAVLRRQPGRRQRGHRRRGDRDRHPGPVRPDGDGHPAPGPLERARSGAGRPRPRLNLVHLAHAAAGRPPYPGKGNPACRRHRSAVPLVTLGGNWMEPAARVVDGRSGRADARRHHESRRAGSRPDAGSPAAPLQVEVVVPVYNEATNLEASITRLRAYLDQSFPFRTVVTIADNGSTDGTALVAQRLASTLDGVQALILSRKGRGYALRVAWSASEAEVVAYMDADLSTSLSGLLPLVGSVLSGHSDLAVGTRLARGSRVVRGPKRELISRAYSHIVRLSLRSHVSDFQCGFKAIRRERALQILPLVDDNEWFFDTELIVTAERLGVRISETPVEWTDDPDSSVDLVRTALDDLHGIWRVARRRKPERVRARVPAEQNHGHRRSAAVVRRGGRAEHPELPAAVRGGLVRPRALAGQRRGPGLLHAGQHDPAPVPRPALDRGRGRRPRAALVRHGDRRPLRRQPGGHHGRHRDRHGGGRALPGRRRAGRHHRQLRGRPAPVLPPARLGVPPAPHRAGRRAP